MVCGGVEHAHNLNTIRYTASCLRLRTTTASFSVFFSPCFWCGALHVSYLMFSYFRGSPQNWMTRSLRECLGLRINKRQWDPGQQTFPGAGTIVWARVFRLGDVELTVIVSALTIFDSHYASATGVSPGSRWVQGPQSLRSSVTQFEMQHTVFNTYYHDVKAINGKSWR